MQINPFTLEYEARSWHTQNWNMNASDPNGMLYLVTMLQLTDTFIFRKLRKCSKSWVKSQKGKNRKSSTWDNLS